MKKNLPHYQVKWLIPYDVYHLLFISHFNFSRNNFIFSSTSLIKLLSSAEPRTEMLYNTPIHSTLQLITFEMVCFKL